MEGISPALSEEYRHTAEKLEFAGVLDLLADYALSPRGKEILRRGAMLPSLEDIEISQGEIAELLSIREEGEDIPLGDWKDSQRSIKSIRGEGSVAQVEDLLAIAAGERKAREVRRYLKKREDKFRLISRCLAGFSIQDDIIARIEERIGPEGEVLDRASRALLKTRRQITGLRDRLRKEFAAYASRQGAGQGNEFVTVRGDRYVVSLPVREASRTGGIVHQSSGSGVSVFIEPLEFVEKNNQLESLIQEEKKEIAKILGELTGQVFRKKEQVLDNQDILLLLDLIAAKASFAQRYACARPVHSRDGSLVLRQARHPLLERRLRNEGGEVIGLDLRCEPDLKVLVISGPNAGGKTVALKTVGLMVMMDRAGLLLPCLDGTTIPFYTKVFVDIGDDQSIEKSLSTFSSRILWIKRMLEHADRSSLILIDEIGDGTDPEEGAALAFAVLEWLEGRCGRVIVTTHMSALKGWAHQKPGVANATLEFDADNLRPLFRMKTGIPGRSWGIEMAGRMGLPADIVNQAKRGMGERSLHLEELLAHLERVKRTLDLKQEELLRKEEELSGLVSKYRDSLDTLQRDRREMVQRARQEALDIVKSTRVEMENLVREIRITQADSKVIRKSKGLIEERRKVFESRARARERIPPLDPQKVKPGLPVMIRSLRKPGRIISVDGSSKVYVELRGGMRVETKMEDLSLNADYRQADRQARISWTTGDLDPVSTELMVRGMDREEALEKVDIFIDRAVLQGLETVMIIHGIGKGILKNAIYEMLREDPRVREVRPGQPAWGGDGVAVIRLK